VVVSRTGWTGEVGYEVFLTDPARGDELWETIMEAGAPHGIRPIALCEARRIEAGIFNCNSDFTLENNPFEVTGMERLVEAQQADYAGQAALERIREQGVTRTRRPAVAAGSRMQTGPNQCLAGLHRAGNPFPKRTGCAQRDLGGRKPCR
jgi:glycine cleavage system aminomethyltransferase T